MLSWRKSLPHALLPCERHQVWEHIIMTHRDGYLKRKEEKLTVGKVRDCYVRFHTCQIRLCPVLEVVSKESLCQSLLLTRPRDWLWFFGHVPLLPFQCRSSFFSLHSYSRILFSLICFLSLYSIPRVFFLRGSCMHCPFAWVSHPSPPAFFPSPLFGIPFEQRQGQRRGSA